MEMASLIVIDETVANISNPSTEPCITFAGNDADDSDEQVESSLA